MKTPNHYNLEIQPVDYIMKNELGFCEGNVVKYISRWRQKNGRDDLLKARHYIDILLDELDKEMLEAGHIDLWDPMLGPSTWRPLVVFVIITLVKTLLYVPFNRDSFSSEKLLDY